MVRRQLNARVSKLEKARARALDESRRASEQLEIGAELRRPDPILELMAARGTPLLGVDLDHYTESRRLTLELQAERSRGETEQQRAERLREREASREELQKAVQERLLVLAARQPRA